MFILPTLPNVDKIYEILSYASYSTTAFVFVSFAVASCKNAGVLKPAEGMSFITMLKDINPADLCPTCKVIRSARSRHCSICNTCVERFDHHCPWINNCVGAGNHNAFLTFLFAIWIKIVFHAAADIYAGYNFIENQPTECDEDDSECELVCVKNLCFNPYVFYTSQGICLLICLFYLLLSTLMLYTHMQNYSANRTTNERFGRTKKNKTPAKKVESSQSNTSMTSSIMSISDFDNSEMLESILGNT